MSNLSWDNEHWEDDDGQIDHDNFLQNLRTFPTDITQTENCWHDTRIQALINNIVNMINVKIPVYHHKYEFMTSGLILYINNIQLFLNRELIDRLISEKNVNYTFVSLIETINKKLMENF